MLKRAGMASALAAAMTCCALGQAGTGDPDVIVGDLQGVMTYGTPSTGTPQDDWIYAYAIGTDSCNIASVNITANDLLWVASTNQHPVIGQNMFRLRVVGGATRLEMIGQSWLKHGFIALTQNLCATCSGRGGSVLGVGCSDPYSASLNGTQSGLGPRSHVNASTGFFPYPFATPPAGFLRPPAAAARIGRRIQVLRSDINPAQNPNTLYFGEGQYVTQDDSAARTTGRGRYQLSTNNASYRRMTIGPAPGFNATMVDTTRRTLPAIWAWREYGGRNPATGQFNNTQDLAVQIRNIDFNLWGDGRFLVAGRATDLGMGRWRYEYAVQNLHSDRSGGSFRVPVPAGVNVTNIGFRDVFYHSGEVFSGTDWIATRASDAVVWRVPETFEQNPNANALRWGTMYNFWFEADQPPRTGSVEVGLFKPGPAGAPNSGVATLDVPDAAPCPCAADFDGSGGVPDGTDVDTFFAAWLDGEGSADVDCSGGVPDGGDVEEFFGQWLAGGC